MKKNYFTVSIERNGKRLAYVKAVSECLNLKGLFPEDADVITAMPTKLEAVATANSWNAVYKADGRELLFDYDVLKYGSPVVVDGVAYWE